MPEPKFEWSWKPWTGYYASYIPLVGRFGPTRDLEAEQLLNLHGELARVLEQFPHELKSATRLRAAEVIKTWTVKKAKVKVGDREAFLQDFRSILDTITQERDAKKLKQQQQVQPSFASGGASSSHRSQPSAEALARQQQLEREREEEEAREKRERLEAKKKLKEEERAAKGVKAPSVAVVVKTPAKVVFKSDTYDLIGDNGGKAVYVRLDATLWTTAEGSGLTADQRRLFENAMYSLLSSGSEGSSGVKFEPYGWVIKIRYPSAKDFGLNNLLSPVCAAEADGERLFLNFKAFTLRHK
jgi:hypothetical protein